MSSLFRISRRYVFGYSHLCKAPMTYNVTQVAFITGKSRRVEKPKRPPPFPYHEQKFGVIQSLIDPIFQRIDDNSKVIVVDGPIAAGKKEFAKQLAEELEMAYIPPVTFDDLYVADNGIDLRDFNYKVHPTCRTCDVETFLREPMDPRNVRVQLMQFFMRLEHYILGLLHVISTGQGVVLPRSVYSDEVFMKSMYDSGYIDNGIYRRYLRLQQNVLPELLRPHLVIYLDIPVNEVLNRIKKRGIPYEVESKVLSPEYLTKMENYYRTSYLRNATDHSHVLVYDWVDKGDIQYVVEDIESLKFDDNQLYTDKMRDWTFDAYEHVVNKRYQYSDLPTFRITYCRMSPFVDGPHDILDVEGDIVNVYDKFREENVPVHYYDIGYDKNVWFLDKDKPVIQSMFHRRIKFPYMEKLMQQSQELK